VQDFARWLLAHEPFVEDFEHFMAGLTPGAEDSALRQLALKLTCPGVPDIFQGDELWRLSLVDPDNRRPVDWDARRDALARVQRGGLPSREDAKIFLIHRALALRIRRLAAFAGAYRPVPAGPDVCAFLRGDDEVLVVVTVRGSEPIALELPGRWHDVLEDQEVAPSALGGGWHGIRLLERHGESGSPKSSRMRPPG
jgi:(1->4)-alpha-D-glucan 1-alpha-D-glucosylmutase